MNNLRTAAQQALEALNRSDYLGWQLNIPIIKALKAALAEPVQEPVAWRWGYRSITTGEMDWRGYVEIPAHPNLRSPAIIMQPLYTAPPQRLPLTDEEIIDATEHIDTGRNGYFIDIARAIERAHGIGDNP